jgi:hypothetical protein
LEALCDLALPLGHEAVIFAAFASNVARRVAASPETVNSLAPTAMFAAT